MDVSEPLQTSAPILEKLEKLEQERQIHASGSIPYWALAEIEKILPDNMEYTAETGCGRSTIFFSQASKNHTVFCLDDRQAEGSSMAYFQESLMYNADRTTVVLGPTQKMLPQHNHPGKYDCVLIDGPHGYPFPDLEYYFFYPHIRSGGYLLIDDVQIASIGRMADIIQEDAMWNLVKLVDKTAVFQRTDSEMLPPHGDHWWVQGYNQRRTDIEDIYLGDGKESTSFEERLLQEKIKHEQYQAEIEAQKRAKKKKKGFLSKLFG